MQNESSFSSVEQRVAFLSTYFSSTSRLQSDSGDVLTEGEKSKLVASLSPELVSTDRELVIVEADSAQDPVVATVPEFLALAPRGTRVALILPANQFASLPPVLSDVHIVSGWRPRQAKRCVAMLRSNRVRDQQPSLSVIVPAKNEAGNIDRLFEQLPDMGDVSTELVLVEGGSSDGTWERIQATVNDYRGPYKIQTLRQSRAGKANAVYEAVAAAKHQLILILDADLTVPPADVPRFYQAYQQSRGDLVNGDRMSLPMEPGAMRFLNRLGNRFFSKWLTHMIRARMPDTLCGTKLLPKQDFERVLRWCDDFDLQDPFGDFSLLMAAGDLGLGITNVEIKYRARVHGITQIHRFRDGLKLMRMCLQARRARFVHNYWRGTPAA